MSTLDVIASVALILGALLSLIAGIAVVRFPDTMSRIHAATKPQVLGIMLLMLGVGLRLESPAVIGLLVLIVVLQFLTAPVAAHLTVRVAYRHSTIGQPTTKRPDGASKDELAILTVPRSGPESAAAQEIAATEHTSRESGEDRGPGQSSG